MFYDFCVATNCDHDAGFISMLHRFCQSRNMNLLHITPANVNHVTENLNARETNFFAFLDRASEDDKCFKHLVEWTGHHDIFAINPSHLARQSWDKSAMHQLLSDSLRTPYTMILSSFHEQPELPALDLSKLGETFNIKPANGGGGEGVVMNAVSLDQVRQARQQYPQDKYLLQTCVRPAFLGKHMAWFRVIYCVGEIYPFWWDTHTHVYIPVTSAEIYHYHLSELFWMMERIAELSGLHLFSSEIARERDGNFIAVDYVNDPIDFRLQSQTPDGVPDQIVAFIAESLVDYVFRQPVISQHINPGL